MARAVPGDALREMTRVRDLWARPAEALARTRSGLAGGPDEAADLGRTVDAVAGALFLLADERRRASVDSLQFPVYAGPDSPDETRKHVAQKVSAWARSRTAAIVAVTPEYEKILALEPASAFWSSAARARVAMMWGDFVDAFRKAPVPREWSQATAVRGAWYDAVDGVSEPIQQNRAKPAMKECLGTSRSLGVLTPYTRDCEAWLAAHYKAEYHVLDELRPGNTLDGSARSDLPRPAQIGGVTTPWGY